MNVYLFGGWLEGGSIVHANEPTPQQHLQLALLFPPPWRTVAMPKKSVGKNTHLGSIP